MKYLPKLLVLLLLLNLVVNQQTTAELNDSENGQKVSDNDNNYIDSDNKIVILPNKAFSDDIQANEKKVYKFLVTNRNLDANTDKIEFSVRTTQNVTIKVFNKYFCSNHEQCDVKTNMKNPHSTESVVIDKDHYLRNPSNFREYQIEVESKTFQHFQITVFVLSSGAMKPIEMMFDSQPIIGIIKAAETNNYEFYLSSNQTSMNHKSHIQLSLQTENPALNQAIRMKLIRDDKTNIFWEATNDLETGMKDPNFRLDNKYILQVSVDRKALDEALNQQKYNPEEDNWQAKSVSDKFQIKYVLMLNSDKYEKIINLNHKHLFSIQAQSSLMFETYIGTIDDEIILRIQNQMILQQDIYKNMKIYLGSTVYEKYAPKHEFELDFNHMQISRQTLNKICSSQPKNQCKLYTQVENKNKEDIFIMLELHSNNAPLQMLENRKDELPFLELMENERKFYFKIYKKQNFQVNIQTTAEILRMDVDYQILKPGKRVETWVPKYSNQDQLNRDSVNLEILVSGSDIGSTLAISIRGSKIVNQETMKSFIKLYPFKSLVVIQPIQGPVHVQIPGKYEIILDNENVQMFYLDTSNLYSFDKDIFVKYETQKGSQCKVTTEYYTDNERGMDFLHPAASSNLQLMQVTYEQLKQTKKVAVQFKSDTRCNINVYFQEMQHSFIKARQLFEYKLIEDKMEGNEHYYFLYRNLHSSNGLKIVFLNPSMEYQNVKLMIKQCPDEKCQFTNDSQDYLTIQVQDTQVMISNEQYPTFIKPFSIYLVKIVHENVQNYLNGNMKGQLYIDDIENKYNVLFPDIPYTSIHRSGSETSYYMAQYNQLNQDITIRFNILEGRVSVNPIYKDIHDITDRDMKSLRQFENKLDSEGRANNQFYIELDSYQISRIKPSKKNNSLFSFITKSIPILVKCQNYCKYTIQETIVAKQILRFGEIYHIHENQFLDDLAEERRHTSTHTFLLQAIDDKQLMNRHPTINIRSKLDRKMDLSQIVNVYVTQFNRSETIINDKKSSDDDLVFNNEDEEEEDNPLYNKVIVNTTRLLEYKLPTITSDFYQVHVTFMNNEDYVRFRRKDNEIEVLFNMDTGVMTLPHNQIVKRSINHGDIHEYQFMPESINYSSYEWYRVDVQICYGYFSINLLKTDPREGYQNNSHDKAMNFVWFNFPATTDPVRVQIYNSAQGIKTIYRIEVIKVDNHKLNLHELVQPYLGLNLLEYKNQFSLEIEPLRNPKESTNYQNYDFSQAKVDYKFIIRPYDDFSFGQCDLDGSDYISLIPDVDKKQQEVIYDDVKQTLQERRDALLDDLNERISMRQIEEKVVKGVPFTTNKKHIIQRFNFIYGTNTTYANVIARLYDVYEIVKGDSKNDKTKVKLNDIIVHYNQIFHDQDEDLQNEMKYITSRGLMERIFSSFWTQCLFWIMISFYVILLIYCFNRSHVRRTMADQFKLQNQINQLKNNDIMTDNDLEISHQGNRNDKKGYQAIE